MYGIINVVKPPHMTSFQVVHFIRKKYQIKRVGHTGTLDPMAAGVLPICVGRQATKMVDYLINDSKTYRCTMKLGSTTDTQDQWGKVLSTHNVQCTDDEIVSTIKSFEGEILQIPPMYSALKHKGKKLYELAREGIEIERKPRKRTIYGLYNIRILGKDKVSFDVKCSKGTYIRTLCYDIGAKLGCGAHMDFLLRLQSGVFNINDCYTLEEIDSYSSEELKNLLLPIDYPIQKYPKLILPNDVAKKVSNGLKIDLLNYYKSNVKLTEGIFIRVYSNDNKFIGIAVYDIENKIIKMRKRFV